MSRAFLLSSNDFQSKSSNILFDAGSALVISGLRSCTPSLDHFKLFHVSFCVGVTDTARVFHKRSYQCLVCFLFDFFRTDFQVLSEESNCPVGLGGDVIDVPVPF